MKGISPGLILYTKHCLLPKWTSPMDPISGYGDHSLPPPSAKKRKPRPKLSCVPCRRKKLKCNRIHPCDNCIKHHRAEKCHFVGPQAVSSGDSHSIHYYIHRLEARVQQLSQESHPSQVPQLPAEHQPLSLPSGTIPESQTDYSGTILIEQDGTSYHNPTHWQAVLDEISEVKEFLQMHESTSPEDVGEEDSIPDVSGPVLLFGNSISSNFSELLAALPLRTTADRLISSYLNSKEAPLVLIHTPTFTREYTAFWKNPQEASISWLAYLYTILSAAAGLHLFTTSGREEGQFAEAFEGYFRLASQCLTVAEYTRPGKYKLEALILSICCEILRSADTHVGPSVLLGLATRLAIHSGYHRDPKHYREITAFDGEMRRRIWMYLCLLDHYVSCQAGLPPTTGQAQSDVEEPRNVTDDDLDPSATALPSPRPATEKTLILFPVTLNRIMFLGAEISRKVCSVQGVPYQEVLDLDAKLRALHADIPPPLRFRLPSESIADPPTTIMDRYNIDLMYQKARSDLHRRYLTQHRLDPQYAYSRGECLDAARRVLQHQFDIFNESSPGGQLNYASFFFSSCVMMHFRVAAMIVSLEISGQSRYDLQQHLPPSVRQAILAQRQELSQALERSYNIWNHLRHQSKEALKTADALRIMLQVANTHLQHGATPGTDRSTLAPVDTGMLYAFSELDPMPPHLSTAACQAQSPQTTRFDVDLMDATLYFGQDGHPQHTYLNAPTDTADFFDRYWENLMVLGDSQSFNDILMDQNTRDGIGQSSS
ncbi:Zn(II)2Cys6 transcription factor [Aspergillus saccharolyticus JOP 1030-1]|uniref:Zn(2)-C6 fungal-type domain-containing protein n=1 Tax=Aspergillus saccharolyticus JOP 1030-1 TaxID=1450539 RepID=A0A319A698_9EURO|nr:hypothetical protein BP01DRAFT_385122 [Aspergillus saccharolyticus JOP 1030-1]PYH42922.1 hypothetical protein BP01DRAFT_385122 [Aspergillus saccharolyticus JOP 1030-1]